MNETEKKHSARTFFMLIFQYSFAGAFPARRLVNGLNDEFVQFDVRPTDDDPTKMSAMFGERSADSCLHNLFCMMASPRNAPMENSVSASTRIHRADADAAAEQFEQQNARVI